jgi:hypothetical protein
MLSNGWFRLDGPNEGAAYPVPNNSFLPLMEGWDVHYSGPGTGVTAQRVRANTPPHAGFAAEIVVRNGGASNAGDHFTFEHKIRADAMGELGWGTATARPVTLAFSAQCSPPGNYAVALVQDLPVPGGRSYVQPYALPDTAWHDFVFTIPGDTMGGWPAVGTGWTLEVDFVLDAGANFQTATTGAWQNGEYLTTPGQTRFSALSGTCRFGKVRLFNAPAPVKDALPPIGTEIAVNLADYFKTYAKGVPVGAAGAAGGDSGPIVRNSSSATIRDTVQFPRRMNCVPGVTGGTSIHAYSPITGAIDKAYDYINNTDVGITLQGQGDMSVNFIVSAFAGGVTKIGFHLVADCRAV